MVYCKTQVNVLVFCLLFSSGAKMQVSRQVVIYKYHIIEDPGW